MGRRALVLLAAALLVAGALAGCVNPRRPAVQDEPAAPTPQPVTPARATPSPSNEAPPNRNATSSNSTPTSPPAAATPIPLPSFDPQPPVAVARPHVVVAIIDTGINPYHAEFRDPSPEGAQHPSEYLPGYPRDARPLRITLGAKSYEEALKADEQAWKGVEPGVLYYVPGTRIVGLIALEGTRGIPGLDESGHGTMTASRAAGRTTSLAPEAKIVAVEGFSAESVSWAGTQPWIDVQSNSWDVCISPGASAGLQGACVRSPITSDVTSALSAVAETQLVAVAAGNGALGWGGVAGQPALLSATAGASGVVSVGGHDNGNLAPWAGSLPHVVADVCANPAASHRSLDEVNARGGSGTSSAAPFVAGAAAALVLEARSLLGDAGLRREGGLYAAKGLVASNAPSEGPLADGDLTLGELKRLLLHTADPTPEASPFDGDECGPASAPYHALPVGAGPVPEPLPQDPNAYWIGYGAVGPSTVALAKDVLSAAAKAPDRSADDERREAAEDLRRALP